MLIGEFHTKLGAKNRVAIPKKLRVELGDELIITRGYENALLLLNKQMWANIANDVANGSFINRNIRDTSRFLIGSASELEPDKQGRVLVPAALKTHAQFDSDVVFVGLMNWVEVWAKELWDKRVTYLIENGEEIASELDKINHE